MLDAWASTQRQIARLQAEAAGLLAERWGLFEEELRAEPAHSRSIERSMMAQYAAMGHVSQGSMVFAFTDARMLLQFPAVQAAFTDGRVTAAHVREILRESRPVREAIDTGEVISDTLGLYEQACLEVAERDTAPRTKVHARRAAAALAGLTVVEQQAQAFSERTVTVRSVGDGLALLQAVLPEYLAVAIHDRLTRMAAHLAGHPEDRNTPPEEPTDAQWDAWEAEFTASERAEQVTLAAIARRRDLEAEMAADATDGGAGVPDTADGTGPDADPEPGAGSEPEGRSEAGPDSTADADQEAAYRDLIARHLDADGFWIDDDPGPHDPPPDPDLDHWTDPRTDPGSPCITHLPDEERTFDQLRADLLSDLLLTTDPSTAHGTGLANIHPTIQVTVAATTLTGQDDRPAELDSHGPLHPNTARALAGTTKGWTRLFLNPRGFVTRTDTYTPTEPMVRFLRARDQHCRFPGCQAPIHRCEHDHNHDWAQGGTTRLDNLTHLCRTHHTLKHPDNPDLARWTARQTSDHTLQWTDPDGRTHPDHEQPRVMFIPSDTLRTTWTNTHPTAEQAGTPF